MKIYKKKINIMPLQKLNLPILKIENSIINVDTQNGEPYIWFLAEDGIQRDVRLYSYMTGENINEDIEAKKYVGSYVLDDGIRIHVFAEL